MDTILEKQFGEEIKVVDSSVIETLRDTAYLGL